ncbi:MAG: hypothetical protein RL531_1123 [Actinomycetota bacterium]
MTTDLVVEDWLWDDDAPEEPEEYELSHEERMLRRRAMQMFFASIVGFVVLAVLGVVAFRIIGDEPVRDLPAACTEGRLSECPTGGAGNREPASNLPGGFDPRTGEANEDPAEPRLSKQEAEARIEKCLRGRIEFCG